MLLSSLRFVSFYLWLPALSSAFRSWFLPASRIQFFIFRIRGLFRNSFCGRGSIMVVGDDWSPEVAFYSKRKALYIPNWVDGFFPLDEVALSSVLKNPESMLGGLKLGSVIIRNQGLERSSLPKDHAVALDEYLAKSQVGLVRTTIGKYDIYLIK
jgi:hypothetical protein